RGLARRFMGGSNSEQALASVKKLRQQQMNFTLDLLGEATISENEADQYQRDYQQLIEQMTPAVSEWSEQDLLDNSHNRTSPRLNLSIKLSSLYSQINAADPVGSVQAIGQRLRPLLRDARKAGAFINLDMEQYEFKHIVLQCFYQILMEDEFRDWPDVGIAMQTYLKDTLKDIQQLIDWVKRRGTAITVRLVRGAYWDYETVIASQNNWDCPVWQVKTDTDASYEECLQLLFNHYPDINIAVASHNYRSIACAITLVERCKLEPQQFEFQMLYGMADHLKLALVEMGFRVRVYVPYGETLPGMAYLVRRLLENSSGQSMLDYGLSETEQTINFSPPNKHSENDTAAKISNRFCNTPVLRFTSATQRNQFVQCLANLPATFDKHYPLIINGKAIPGDEDIYSYNPAQADQLVGIVSAASQSQADEALNAALDASKHWRSRPVAERAAYLKTIASKLQQQRMTFAAWQVFEAGKNWHEADADVCEAIDFLNYYAEQAEQIELRLINELNGEHNQVYHRGKGVGLVIPPWNFPLAILTGMLSATIVSGNTAILKPSSLTPVIAANFMQLIMDSGLPPGVVNFLPGSGSRIGEYLALKPDINLIAFTGSQQVGTRLIELGAKLQPGQTHIKHVIAEMGGKNTLIIDQDADLDDAILGVLHSAFGFQGQKCSAASRVIVVGKIYNRFIERLIAAAKSLTIGNPIDPGHFMGPVIDDISRQRILTAIDNGEQAGELLLFDQTSAPEQGYYIPPTIFTHVDPDSPLAQEEIFGPVLSIIPVDNFEQAIDIANNTRYALTGGLYSRQPSHLQLARETFNVGNLYLNRKITGALVSRQPFGGFKMSGVGSKAGGKDYLLQFMDTVCVTENTLRRGFAPKVDGDLP
ncbi:MAG: bifunctional proline dehydrogenase/L-glutamate gamma-semialdehyde dehydrogenase, partial [Gammaproteobacteria bacterium]|nr:bifunctional proline dehydrogenase/L-glutamate gamma-semialdehyde dehydrogenase [Gammaproteobacteria bacterium]